MALFAVDDDDLIDACDAEPGKVYWCLDCFGPVKRRRGKLRFYHFYHTRPAPTCRLYSKTEDHLLAQLQLQKQFPAGALRIEQPFIKINRVADVLWEREKIVFEIQCSPMTVKEAEMRIRDYHTAGYEVIWLLDDKRYNKRVIRPAEDFLRRHSTYYTSIQQGFYYDQFEVFASGVRVKKGRRLPIDLQRLRPMPKVQFNEEFYPKQITQLTCAKYFHGDRIHRALLYPQSMLYWRALEIQLTKEKPKPNRLLVWLYRAFVIPYQALLAKAIRKLN
ncbi:MAG TPA: competence protein CoiA family protein [Chlamydiales bacterium]|nr:competence protein CoiA family protein [Chlamydiales bacterium]